jgi:hypothetical protein
VSVFGFIGFILRDARKSGLLRMRSRTLMVRSASSRVSNHGHGAGGNDTCELENTLSRSGVSSYFAAMQNLLAIGAL